MITVNRTISRSDMIRCALCANAPCDAACEKLNPAGLLRSIWFADEQAAAQKLPGKDLLTGILREEWGFDGMVTTDWWTFGEHYKEVAAGNDMKMATGFPDRLQEAVEKGVLTRAEMEKAAENILRLILRID